MMMLPMYHIGKISPIYRQYNIENLIIKDASQCYVVIQYGMFGDNTNWRAGGPGGLEGHVSK